MFFRRRKHHMERELEKLAEKIHHMSIEIDSLKTQVATTISLETQAIALLKAGGGGMPGSDLAQVIVATGQLRASSDALAVALGGGGTSTESTDAANIISLAQQAASAASDPAEVTRLVAQMQAHAASLSGAFTRNTPPLSSQITQQEVAALDGISQLLTNLAGVASDPDQVTRLAGQIQNATQSLAAIITANPRGGPPTARRVGR